MLLWLGMLPFLLPTVACALLLPWGRNSGVEPAEVCMRLAVFLLAFPGAFRF